MQDLEDKGCVLEEEGIFLLPTLQKFYADKNQIRLANKIEKMNFI